MHGNCCPWGGRSWITRSPSSNFIWAKIWANLWRPYPILSIGKKNYYYYCLYMKTFSASEVNETSNFVLKSTRLLKDIILVIKAYGIITMSSGSLTHHGNLELGQSGMWKWQMWLLNGLLSNLFKVCGRFPVKKVYLFKVCTYNYEYK